ncbi:Uncharacterized protein Fot_36626 [Forsythia ovata]|uniref:Uncharacterized protein n=1 Tax=Forsythia ovata TaxID=205694 RepID=A0ABD1SSR3_9LAMI
MTRSAAKKESPDIVKKPVFHSKQKVIYLDTPTSTKGSIFEKNRNPHDEGGHWRMGSCSSKGMHKNENMDKPMSDKVAHTSSPSKIKKPPVYEAQLEIRVIDPDEEERRASYMSGLFQYNRAAPNIEDVDDGHFVYPPVRLQKTLNPDPFRACNESKNAKNFTSKLKEFYTDDVMEQVEEILKSAEKSKNSDTIEWKQINVP